MVFITTIATSFATAMATNSLKSAQGPGQALDDIMTLVGFQKLHEFAEKRRIITEQNIIDYKEKIAVGMSQIPTQNIKEPPVNIVGPAIEASQYYIDDEILRSMFANLISSSMDIRKTQYIHPSFVEIIKQLSPSDALFLHEFARLQTGGLPYGKVIAIEDKNDSLDTFDEFKKLPSEDWLEQTRRKSRSVWDHLYRSDNMEDIFENELSISSLSRLGLIEIRDQVTIAVDHIYDEIQETYSDLSTREEFNPGSDLVPHNYHLELKKGSIYLTPFGSVFLESCIEVDYNN